MLVVLVLLDATAVFLGNFKISARLNRNKSSELYSIF